MIRAISPVHDLRALIALFRFLRRSRFDIVHTHSSKAGIIGRVAARAAGVPIVVHTLHGLVFHEYETPWKNALYITLKKLCAPLADRIISVNQKTLDGALARGIGRTEQHVKIYSGMDLEPFLAAARDLPAATAKLRAGLPDTARVVGKVARLFPLKGHDLFLDMAAIVAREDADAYFLIVGGGILREALETRAKELGILNRVRFTGLVRPEEVPALMQAMDVVAHTSLREGIPRVIPQAGAMLKPVVTWNLDGAPEVIEDGVSGYLLPAQDVASMAERVVRLLRAPDLREKMASKLRAFAVEHYPADVMVRRINAVYEELLAAKGLAGRSR
jgi:glycosyltransferase involved in cell wall biosynthesis